MPLYHTYIDWTTEDMPRPFYVGKGLNQRVKRRYRNSLHRHLIEQFGLRREVVLTTDDEHEALHLKNGSFVN